MRSIMCVLCTSLIVSITLYDVAAHACTVEGETEFNGKSDNRGRATQRLTLAAGAHETFLRTNDHVDIRCRLRDGVGDVIALDLHSNESTSFCWFKFNVQRRQTYSVEIIWDPRNRDPIQPYSFIGIID